MINEEEVTAAIKQMKSGRAPGPAGVTNKLLRGTGKEKVRFKQKSSIRYLKMERYLKIGKAAILCLSIKRKVMHYSVENRGV